MKRKEMLRKLENLCSNYFYNDYEGHELAKEVLDLVDEHMLPRSKFDVPHQDSLYFWEENENTKES